MAKLIIDGNECGGSVDTTNFTSSDVADGSATSWTSVTPITNDEPNLTLFPKLSQIAKNVRYLYKMLGTTDISAIGNGTVTNAISTLDTNKNGKISFYRTSGPANSMQINAGAFTIIVSPITLPAGTYIGFASHMSEPATKYCSYLRVSKSGSVGNIMFNDPYFNFINGTFTLTEPTSVALYEYASQTYTVAQASAGMFFIKIA